MSASCRRCSRGRLTNQELGNARHVDLAVLAPVRQLEESGVIQGYRR